jgi:hypothetical protein
LDASNIDPAKKKALHLCKALILLVFLAPRPGLEPGTYGLTVAFHRVFRDVSEFLWTHKNHYISTGYVISVVPGGSRR